MKTRISVWFSAVALFLCACPDGFLSAAPIVVRVEVGGVAQVLRGGAKTSRPGYHFGHDRIYLYNDAGSSAYSVGWLDPTRTGNLGGSIDSRTGSIGYWNTSQQLYGGTVSGNLKTSSGTLAHGCTYLPDHGTMLFREGNSDGRLRELEAARSVSGADVLTEGTFADQTTTGRLRTTTTLPASGEFGGGLVLSGSDATYYYFLTINNIGVSASQQFRRFQLTKAYAVAPTATTAGSRTFSGEIENHVPAATVNGLVPGYNDVFTDLANDQLGRIWALSYTGGTNFLTAFTIALNGTVTQIDLDPDDDNGAGSKYVNLDGKIKMADGVTNVNGNGIAVNADGSRIYILANGNVADTVWDSLYVFRLALPEILNVGAVNIDTNSVDMVGYLAAESGTVTCYWGTNNGGTIASAWMTNTPMGAQTAPIYLTNSVSGLTKGTPYYFRYKASNNAGDAWATNTIPFVTLGVDTTVLIGNGGGPINVTATGARLQGQVLSGNPDPNVWIYWGTTEGTTNKTGWNMPTIDKGAQALVPFYQDVSGLSANQQYWYRCYASNGNAEANEAWAGSATNFTTAGPEVAINDVTVLEGAGSTTTAAVFTVTLSATSAVDVVVNYTTTDNTATVAGSDYTAVSSSITIPAGSLSGTLTVTVNGDDRIEYPSETFYVDLTGASPATLFDNRGVCTILDEDTTYYVRHGGAGAQNGTDWANAFSQVQSALNVLIPNTLATRWVIRVEASSGAQSYNPISRSFDTGHLFVDFEGGWVNVDTSPAQTGYSVVKDTTGPIDQRGFNLESSGSSHDRTKYLRINRFRFSDVTDGIRVYHPNNIQGSTIRLGLNDCAVVAQSNGVSVVFYEQDPVVVTITNLNIQAGLSGTGHGIYLWTDYNGSTITRANVTSSGGNGLFLLSRPATFNGAALDQTLLVTDSSFTNCLNDGIRHEAANEPARGGTAKVYLNRVKLTGNGTDGSGHGLFMQQDTQTGYPRPAMVLSMTNVLAAGNADCGVFLDGNLDADAAGFNATLVNCTVANNGSNAIYGVSSESSGNSVTAYNTLFAGHAQGGIKIVDLSTVGPALTESYNDFYGNAGYDLARLGTSGITNPALNVTDLTVDPKFSTKPPDPYRLALNSPLLDAGTNAPAPAVDILLGVRPDGLRVSMGAYETGIAGTGGTLIILR